MRRSSRAEAEMEIKGLSQAIERYRMLQGSYPPIDVSVDGTVLDATPGSASLVFCLRDYPLGTQGSMAVACKFANKGPLYSFRADRLKKNANGFEYVADPWGRPYMYVPAKSYKALLPVDADDKPINPDSGQVMSGPDVEWWGATQGGSGKWVNPNTFILVSRGDDGTTDWANAERRYRDEDDVNNF